MHIESFSAQPAPTNTGILPHDLEITISPLELQVYQNLFKHSSLIKILRILALNNYMKILLSEEIEASAVNSLTKVAVLFQPKYLSKIRKFKPTQENLKNAFYQLVRSSQTHFKPSSKYFLPVTLNNGLIVASLRYEEKTAEEILGIKFLPLISSHDHK